MMKQLKDGRIYKICRTKEQNPALYPNECVYHTILKLKRPPNSVAVTQFFCSSANFQEHQTLLKGKTCFVCSFHMLSSSWPCLCTSFSLVLLVLLNCCSSFRPTLNNVFRTVFFLYCTTISLVDYFIAFREVFCRITKSLSSSLEALLPPIPASFHSPLMPSTPAKQLLWSTTRLFEAGL